jgi:Cu(I)/Ag(I) efflux system membrane fusion protein
MKKTLITALLAFALGVLFSAAFIWFSHPRESVSTSAKDESKVLFWYDPMYPNVKFDAPGASPFMDMDLLPRYADERDANDTGFVINQTQTQNIGLKTSQAHFGVLEFTQTLPANLDYNDHDLVIIQPRAKGFVEKVYPFTAGESVRKGDALLEITVPEWVDAQSEYLFSKSENAIERLRLLGMPSDDIELLKTTDTLQTRFTIKAPISGVITAYELREGMNFSSDNIIAKIQGVSPIWINAYAPQYIASTIDSKSTFKASFTAFPDKEFALSGVVVLPSVDKEAKTLMIRAKIDNKNAALKPNMNAYIKIKTRSKKMLLIPSSAVIDEGARQHVITVTQEGDFVPKEIKILGEANSQTAVSGLSENESVVSSGVFLIDSEANIAGALERLKSGEATKP